MANYTLKELRELTTEELIVSLLTGAYSSTKANRKKEEQIAKILSERDIINQDKFKETMERESMW